MALADGKPTAITGTAAATADVARGTHYVCGHYSRDNGSLVHRLEDMMQTADDRDRDLLRRCIDELKR